MTSQEPRLWGKMSVQDRLEYLRTYGTRDEFVRFITEHYRLRGMHHMDALEFFHDITDLIDTVLDRGHVCGREAELAHLAAVLGHREGRA
jgi:hypothetical protein